MRDSDNMDRVGALDVLFDRFIRSAKSKKFTSMHNLTTTQLYILRYLSVAGDAKSSDIAKWAGLSPGAITQVCDELVRLEFVERARSNEDRRVVYVRLTDAGRAKMKDIISDRSRHFNKMLERLGEENANELIRLLEQLVSIMEEDD